MGVEMSKYSTEDFYSSENTLYSAIMMDICAYIFAQIHKIYKSKSKRVNANVN